MFRKVFGTVLVLAFTSPLAHAGVLPSDAIDLSQATVYNSPADIANWPVTAAITQLTMQPGQSAGLSFQSAAISAWPNYTPPGWDGPIEYTVWAVVNINGHWYTSGFIQMWRERASTGAPILTDFARNWAYDGRWGPMAGHQPQVGELMGFFLSAGNARGVGTATSVRERTNVVAVALPANDTGVFTFQATGAGTISITTAKMDFDGDGKAEIGVYRPSSGQWLGLASSTNYTTQAATSWGVSTDVPAPGDYDGDGKTDVAVYRPNEGNWYLLLSSTNFDANRYVIFHWGLATDIPVPGDYDGDGRTDPAVYRPSTGVWYILRSTTNFTTFSTYQWGVSTDQPVPGDYDGDGKTDVAVYRPNEGVWYLLLSSTNFDPNRSVTYHWGLATDIPVPRDYDGDGKTDPAVYRPTSGSWWVLHSSTNATTFGLFQWGMSTDIPVPADYDGDGKADLGIYRPMNGQWYILTSGSGYTLYNVYHWGISTDLPMGKVP